MAVSYVSSASAAANTVAMPSHQAGDLIVVFAYRDGNTTAPSLVSGFTSIDATGANTNSARLAYKIAASGSESTGTWTNATGIVVHVYRGAGIGNLAVGGGSATTVTYPALTLNENDGSSWVARFAGHRTATNMTTNTPSGYTQRTGVATEVQGSDTNGGVSTNPTSGTQSVNQNSGYRAYTLEIGVPVAFPFIETFESGSLPASFDSQNTSATVTQVIDSTSKVSGTYSTKIGSTGSGIGAYLAKDLFLDYTSLFFQFKIFVPTAFAYTTATTFVLLHISDAAGNTVIELKMDDYGTQEIILQGGTLPYTDSTLALSKNVVHTVELGYVVHGSSGSWKIWVDNGTVGSPSASASSLNTGTTPMKRVSFGSYYTDGTITNNVYLDDFKVSSSFIGTTPAPVTLTVNDVASSAPLDTTTLTQKYTLSTSDVGSTATLDTVSLVQKYTLVAQDAASSALLDGIALTQKHLLSINELSSGDVLDAVSLTQKNTLVVSDSSSGASIDTVALTQKSTLSVADVGSAALLDGVTVTVSYELGINDLTSTSLLDSIALSQSYTLELDNIGSDSALEAVSLASGYVLTANDVSSAATIDSVALVQKHTLAVADVASQTTLEETSLSQRVTLSVNDLSGTTSLSSVLLTTKTPLSVSDVLSTSAVGTVDLAQKSSLSVQEVSSQASLENIAIQFSSGVDIRPIEIIVQDSILDLEVQDSEIRFVVTDSEIGLEVYEKEINLVVEDSYIEIVTS